MSDSATGGRRLLNATAIMASGTMVSRVFGFARNILLAIAIGNGTLRVDAFTNALTVPNSLYILVIGGTLTNVLVPQIVRAIQHDEDGGKAFVDRIMTAFFLILAVLTVVLTLLTPWVMSVYTSEAWRTDWMAEHWQALLLMSYITMPQVLFYGVFFMIGQVLNARDRFGPMMWAPIVNNVVSITVLSVYLGVWGSSAADGAAFTTEQCVLLGAGSTLGIFLQTCVLVPYLKKVGFSYRPRFDFKGAGLGRTFHVAKWMVGYVAVISLAQIVVQNQASLALPGAINPLTGEATVAGGWTVYQNAYLIWILPHSLITVSLATAMLPSASRFGVSGDKAGVAQEAMRAVRLATTFIVPACLAYAVLFDPITRLIFGNGAGARDYHFISWALLCFAIGLVPYTLQYLYLRAFYAIDDTKTPFLLQIAISGVNAALAIGLVWMLNHPGSVAARLALAYSLSYILGVFITHRALAKRLPGLRGAEVGRHLARLLVAALPAVGVAFGVTWFAGTSGSGLLANIGLLVGVALAVVIYFFIAKRLHIAEATQLVGILRRSSAAVAAETPVDDEDTTTAVVPADDNPAIPEIIAEPMPEDPTEIAGASGISPSAAVAGASGISPSPVIAGASSGVSPSPVIAGASGVSPSPVIPDSFRDLGRSPAPDVDNTDPDGRGVFVPLTAAGQQEADAEHTAPITGAVQGLVSPGDVLENRYRVEALRGVRGTTQVFLAFDELLEREVLIHLLAPGDPRAVHVSALAKDIAAATDSRILRILDVIPEDPRSHGVYLIGEYVAGQTLGSLLAEGPLTGEETAWVVREIADALASCHAQGLYHRHLNPDTVIITSNGNVKVTGMLADEALNEVPGGGDDEAKDVQALGRLLFAGLSAHWPGATRYGLPGADSTRPLGIDQRLETIIDRIGSLVPKHFASRLTTAQEVTTALSLYLGPVSAAQDLRTRLELSTDEVPISQVTPPEPVLPEGEASAGPPTGASSHTAPFVAEAMRRAEVFTPVPPPATAPAANSTVARPKPWVSALVIGLGVAIVGVALYASATFRDVPATPTPSATPTPTETVALAVAKISSAKDFDPKADGGSGGENPGNVKKAIDGKANTNWKTERYGKAAFGGLKPGAGLVVKLSKSAQVAKVELTLVGEPTNLKLMVPADEYSVKTVADWKEVAAADKAGQSVVFEIEPVKTKYLLIYLTSLPKDGKNYRGGIAEVKVSVVKE
ncbi:MAG: murein biosynthesis integral membrane protein MurJ [Propionibacteriaceae bacterium]|jgi:putative peptidoglycan lipid II flippase|nr:murein biosynthesis integral membrane protein MurJ [Propionibacteriaceae bacterium]